MAITPPKKFSSTFNSMESFDTEFIRKKEDYMCHMRASVETTCAKYEKMETDRKQSF